MFFVNMYVHIHIHTCIRLTQPRVLCLIYTHDACGHAANEDKCAYISQSMSACVITNMLHFRHSKNLPITYFKYIVIGTRCDCGSMFCCCYDVSSLYFVMTFMYIMVVLVVLVLLNFKLKDS